MPHTESDLLLRALKHLREDVAFFLHHLPEKDQATFHCLTEDISTFLATDGWEDATPPTTDASERMREALELLEHAEADYRRAHDLHGDGSSQAGRAWDLMRRAGGEARAALTPTNNEVSDEG